MEDQRGARFVARERGVIGDGGKAEPSSEPPRCPLAQRLDAESILAVLPYLGIETVAEFEQEYGTG